MDYQSVLISVIGLVAFIAIFKLLGKLTSGTKAKAQTVSARIVSKDATDETDYKGSSVRHITFYIPLSKEEIRLSVSKRVFREMPDFGNGTLTYAGDQFLKFEYKGTLIEK